MHRISSRSAQFIARAQPLWLRTWHIARVLWLRALPWLAGARTAVFDAMRAIAHWRVGARMALGFAVVIGWALLVLCLSFARMAAMHRAVEQTTGIEWQRMLWVTGIESHARASIAASLERMLSTDPERIAALDAAIAEDQVAIERAVGELEDMYFRTAGKGILGKIKKERADLLQALARTNDLLAAGDRAAAVALAARQVAPANKRLMRSIEELLAYQRGQVEASAASVGAAYLRTRILLVLVGLAALLSGSLFAWWITRGVVRPLTGALEVAERVAQGDLTSEVSVRGRDESAQLLAALAHMNAALGAMVRQVREHASSVADASAGIARNGEDLNQSASEQAERLQAVMQRVEQLAAAVQASAGNADSADRLASQAADLAFRGGEEVSAAVHSMADIERASAKVAEIIGVIDDIAFQTNLLSLNAAIEAAQAGEHGRGFAVVAGEVRSLSQRTKEASREVRALIEGSLGYVREGRARVDQATATTQEVIATIREVALAVDDISRSAGEQARDVGIVGDDVHALARLTERTASLADASSRSDRLLRADAEGLDAAVARFRLPADQGCADAQSVSP